MENIDISGFLHLVVGFNSYSIKHLSTKTLRRTSESRLQISTLVENILGRVWSARSDFLGRACLRSVCVLARRCPALGVLREAEKSGTERAGRARLSMRRSDEHWALLAARAAARGVSVLRRRRGKTSSYLPLSFFITNSVKYLQYIICSADF